MVNPLNGYFGKIPSVGDHTANRLTLTTVFSPLRRILPGLLLGVTLLPAAEEVGSRVCAACHAGIYRTYMATGMARSSGATGRYVDKPGRAPFHESWKQASFSHAVSGVEYRLSEEAKGYLLEYSRPGTDVKGQRLLEWFIGSGELGRSYLFSMDGFLYQSPVSYYSSANKWQISPGYESKRNIDLTRAVETACLQCHASRLQPVAGTQNRFASPPFEEGGVSCERCHGPGQTHAAGMRGGRDLTVDATPGIVNPRKLGAEARDSVCAQCHLTGAARIARKAAGPRAYRAGDALSAGLAVFVWSDGGGSELTATSHYERLSRSACKRMSGDKLWCGSCHDPHASPAAANRAQYYRERCLLCHQTKGCAESPKLRRANGDDCSGCHMPKSATRSSEHVAFTDHGIIRRKEPPRARGNRVLSSFWQNVSERDIALGYAVVAASEPGFRREALGRLESAEARDPNDVAVLAQLAQFYDRLGRENQAMALCDRIVKLDPTHISAAVNLGIYRIKRGMTEEAVRLWEGALQRNPALTGARLNLAVVQYRSGKLDLAEASLLKALEYDPDSDLPRKLLGEVRAARR